MLTAPRLSLHLPRAGGSRLTYRRLRRPTQLPTMADRSPVLRYLDRIGWLFTGR